MLQILAPLYVGYTQVLFAPGRTPVVPTSNLTIQAVLGTGCSYMICVPAFLEVSNLVLMRNGRGEIDISIIKMWAQDEGAVAHLQQMKGIVSLIRSSHLYCTVCSPM